MTDSEFAEYPEIRLLLRRLRFFLAIWKRDLALPTDAGTNARVVADMNAIVRFQLRAEASILLATGVTKDEAVRAAYAKVRADVESAWPRRYLEPAEERAIATRLAYDQDLRLAAAGPKDSRMEAARMAAAVIGGLDGEDPAGTIRKSLQRLRGKLRGRQWIGYDPETLTAYCVDAEDEIFGDLPRKAGRPTARRSQTDN